MPRRRAAERKSIIPDPKFGNIAIAKFINHLMKDGKKSVAEAIVYKALDLVQSKENKDPIQIFDEAIDNVKPAVEVKSRRVGGATYQVPQDVRPDRQVALAMRWIIDAAAKRGEQGMVKKLAGEFLDAAKNIGAAKKKREEVHAMADANKAFAHFNFNK